MQRSRLNRQKKTRKRVFVALGIFFLVFCGFLLKEFLQYVPALFQLTFDKKITLRKTQQQRVDILLLGIGGGDHEGPLLTDTIMFASIDPTIKKVTLVSLPRDLWVPDLQAKINTAYAFGEEKEKGEGISLARKTIEKIVGQPVDYVVRVDFDGFVKAVDLVGGLDIDVGRTFDDYEYPIVGKENDSCGHPEEDLEKLATASSQLEAFPCRYEHLHFDEGVEHMDGETALKYVRSRHALGPEGTDFARSQRQEKIISAFKDKVFSLGTILNPVKLVGLYDILKGSIDTDIKQDEYDDFVKLAKKMQKAKIQSVVLDYGDESEERQGLLINPPLSQDFHGAWVLTPRTKNGDFSEIQKYVDCQIKIGDCEITQTGIMRKPSPTPVPQ